MDRQDKNQELLIENAVKGGKRVVVFLKSGVPLKGRILDHDSYTIFMETEKKRQALIYKHSVTSIFPVRVRTAAG